MLNEMHYGNDYKKLPVTSIRSGLGVEVRPDVYMYTNKIVNVIFIGYPHQQDFILVDAGMPKSADELLEIAKKRFGENSKAKAIILTHGHFDHVGSVIELANEWDCPIYAHEKELPYLIGEKAYPKPDSRVDGGGLVTKLSPAFPILPVNLTGRVQPFNEGNRVPYLPEFQWLHVPGHSPGQVALFREKDRLLIAGDAFVTTNQDKLYQVLTQKVTLTGPPRYLTTDWQSARESVSRLQQLKPYYAITGHGAVVTGELLERKLAYLVENWNELAQPNYGKYV